MSSSVDFGKTFSATFKTYRARLGGFLALGFGLAVVTFLFAMIYTLIFMHWLTSLVGSLPATPAVADLHSMPWVTGLMTGILCLPALVGTWWANLGFCAMADSVQKGQKMTILQAAKQGWARLVSLLPVIVVAAVAVGILMWGMIAWILGLSAQVEASPNSVPWGIIGAGALITILTLVIVVVAIWLTVKWFVTFPVMVSEQASVWKALRRSWRMTKGSGLMIFLIVLVAGIVIGVVSQIGAIPGSIMIVSMSTSASLSSAGVAHLLGQTTAAVIVILAVTCVITALTAPVLPIASQVVYRERLDRFPAS